VSAAWLALLQQGVRTFGVTLTADELAKFALFAAELKKWNKKINLTAITSDEEIAVKHFIDSLTLVQIVEPAGTLLDIGSGGGFPAIPIKIIAPELTVISVDAVLKKINFQRQVMRLLTLDGFSALHVRAEDLVPQYAGHFDWIVSRAFADLSIFAGIATPLLKSQGRIVAMKGRGGRDEAEEAREKLAMLGLEILRIKEFNLPGSGDQRCLIEMCKVSTA
jgi:16S rRNA (guanine527-N7)-methyltransferase